MPCNYTGGAVWQFLHVRDTIAARHRCFADRLAPHNTSFRFVYMRVVWGGTLSEYLKFGCFVKMLEYKLFILSKEWSSIRSIFFLNVAKKNKENATKANVFTPQLRPRIIDYS